MENGPSVGTPRLQRKRPSLLLWLLGLAVIAVLIWSGVLAVCRAADRDGASGLGRAGESIRPCLVVPQSQDRRLSRGDFHQLCVAALRRSDLRPHPTAETLQGMHVTASVSHPRDIDIAADLALRRDLQRSEGQFPTDVGRSRRSPQRVAARSLAGGSSAAEDIAVHGSAGAVGFTGAVHETAVTAAQRVTQDGPAIDFDLTPRRGDAAAHRTGSRSRRPHRHCSARHGHQDKF